MTWAVWLAVPVVVTLLAALVTWLRARPRRRPGTRDTMRAHSDYLDALAQTARSRDRGPAGSPARPPGE